MADLTTHTVTTDGTAPAFTSAAAGGDTVETGNGHIIVVKNSDGAATHDFTIAYPGELASGDEIPDKTYTVPSSGEIWAPLLRQYGDPANDQRAAITYTDATSLTLVALRLE